MPEGNLEVRIENSRNNQGPPGLSAYEIAVENGFEGTEEEWLDSLKGEDGGGITEVTAEDVALPEGTASMITYEEAEAYFVNVATQFGLQPETAGAAIGQIMQGYEQDGVDLSVAMKNLSVILANIFAYLILAPSKNYENTWYGEQIYQREIPALSVEDAGSPLVNFATIRGDFDGDIHDLASLFAASVDIPNGDGTFLHIRNAGLLVDQFNSITGEFTGKVGAILYSLRGVDPETYEPLYRWGIAESDSKTIEGLVTQELGQVAIGPPILTEDAVQLGWLQGKYKDNDELADQIADAAEGAVSNANDYTDNQISNLNIPDGPEPQAGKQIYSGAYQASELSDPDSIRIDPGYGNPDGNYIVPLVNDVDVNLDPGYINFTALTNKTRLVFQVISWMGTASPAPAPSEYEFTAPSISITLTDDDGGSPMGNPRTLAKGDSSRILRQMEVVVNTTPGNTYRWQWLMLVGGGAGAYMRASSREPATLNIYSA